MAEKEFDSWQTVSGLPDDFDFTITGARFRFDPQYNNGETLLLELEGESDSEDLDRPLLFPCGSGWDTPDNGKTAVHPRLKGFHKRSHYGMLIERCRELGIIDLLQKRGAATEAKVWVGLKFHFKREVVSYGAEIGEKEKLLPTAFLGEVGKSKAGAVGTATAAKTAKATAKPAPESQAESETQANGDYGGAPGELVEQVRKLAKTHKALARAKKSSFERFQEEALGLDGVTEWPDLVSAIIDEEAGLWAQV